MSNVPSSTLQPRRGPLFSWALRALILLLAAGTESFAEPVVWSGRTFLFEKEDWADWTLPENQDRFRDNVWNSFNTGYQHY